MKSTQIAQSLWTLSQSAPDQAKLVDQFAAFLEKQNLVYLAPEIIKNLEQIQARHEQQSSCQVVSAAALSPQQVTDLAAKMNRQESDIKVSIDPAVIGGMRIVSEGRLYDATLQTQLQNLRELLATAE